MSLEDDILRAALAVVPDALRYIRDRVTAGSSVEAAEADARAMFAATRAAADEYQRRMLGDRE